MREPEKQPGTRPHVSRPWALAQTAPHRLSAIPRPSPGCALLLPCRPPVPGTALLTPHCSSTSPLHFLLRPASPQLCGPSWPSPLPRIASVTCTPLCPAFRSQGCPSAPASPPVTPTLPPCTCPAQPKPSLAPSSGRNLGVLCPRAGLWLHSLRARPQCPCLPMSWALSLPRSWLPTVLSFPSLWSSSSCLPPLHRLHPLGT